ncbi:MAG: fibrobacter succinogenes major paralogous domain-containing protein [Alistipes sp.]|nr:fibrobacter succinogenes major paralogous domain-containing protein [Alistipes sp.]
MLPLPVSGYRNYTSGALGGVGTEGSSWSSAPYAAGNPNVGRILFQAGGVNPLNNTNRSFGFPVRCVQHLRAAFTDGQSLDRLFIGRLPDNSAYRTCAE